MKNISDVLDLETAIWRGQKLTCSFYVTTKPKQQKKTSQSISLHETAIISHTTKTTTTKKMFNYHTVLTPKKVIIPICCYIINYNSQIHRKAKKLRIISQQEDKTFKCCRAIYYCAEDTVLQSSTSEFASKSSGEQDFQKASLPSSAKHTKSSSSSARHYEHMQKYL